MQGGIKNMHSDCASSSYLHTKPTAHSDHNNLQFSCDDVHTYRYFIPLVYNKRFHVQDIW